MIFLCKHLKHFKYQVIKVLLSINLFYIVFFKYTIRKVINIYFKLKYSVSFSFYSI